MHVSGAAQGFQFIVPDPTPPTPRATTTLDLVGPTPVVVPNDDSAGHTGDHAGHGSAADEGRGASPPYNPVVDLIGRLIDLRA